MRAIRFVPGRDDPAAAIGGVLAHSVYPAGERRRPIFKKGHRLAATDLVALSGSGLTEFHLVLLDPDEAPEDVAAQRLSRIAAGEGLEPNPPVESQVRLVAAARGVLHVDEAALADLNSIEDLCVYTLYDGQVVREGTPVAAVKVTPLAVSLAHLDAAEAVRVARGPAVRVAALRPHRVGALVRERLDAAGRVKFERVLRHKLDWLGSELIEVRDATGDSAAAAAAIEASIGAGAEVILVGGVTSLDPLDALIGAIPAVGGHFVRRGMPAHPGSTYWLADVAGVPVVGVASCGLFSEATLLDLLLPRLLTGERPTARDLARLGHGGMLGKHMGFRFPDYGDDGGAGATGAG